MVLKWLKMKKAKVEPETKKPGSRPSGQMARIVNNPSKRKFKHPAIKH